jgi:hypothetical protein
VEVLDGYQQRPPLTARQAHLPQGLEGAGFEGFWRQHRNGVRSLLHPQHVQEIGCGCRRVHAHFVQGKPHLVEHGCCAIALGDTAVLPHHVDNRMVRNAAAIGEAPPFEIRHPFLGHTLPELVEQARFTAARFGNNADDLAVPGLDLGEDCFQGG